MVRALTRDHSIRNSRSMHNRGSTDATRDTEDQSMEQPDAGTSGSETPMEKSQLGADLEQMKERFAKLLLGEDMSGGGKGVSSALALSNAVTNLAASIFGEKGKLEPMAPDRKERWRKEIDWLLAVTDYIVEFVPSQQKSKDGAKMEIMITKQRGDLQEGIPDLRKLDSMLTEILDSFAEQKEFWYVSRQDDTENGNTQRDDKWWQPVVKVPPKGLSEPARRWLQSIQESVSQVLKAAVTINTNAITEMEIPENYIDSLPKNGRSSLGDSIYKSITVEYFDPKQFLSTLDLSTEHKVLDLKNRIEASIVIWKRKMKMNHKDSRSWGSTVSMEKRELFEVRAETILLLLRKQFPGLPQSTLDISKIQYNRDVGQAILESYSRVIESLAHRIKSRVEDVLHADHHAKRSLAPELSDEYPQALSATEMPTLSDFMGWDNGNANDLEKKRINFNDIYANLKDKEKKSTKLFSPSRKITSYLEIVEAFNGLRSPNDRD